MVPSEMGTFTTEETNGRQSLHGPQAAFTNFHPTDFCVHRCQLPESFLPLSPASLCQPELGICTSSQFRPLQLRKYKTLASSPAAGPPCCVSAQGCPSNFVPELTGLAAVLSLPCLLYVCLLRELAPARILANTRAWNAAHGSRSGLVPCHWLAHLGSPTAIPTP